MVSLRVLPTKSEDFPGSRVSRCFSSACRMKRIKRVTEFRKGPFSALPPKDAPKPPPEKRDARGKAIPLEPAKVRLMKEDCESILKSRFVMVMQDVNLQSSQTHTLRTKCSLHGVKVKFVRPVVLSDYVMSEKSLGHYGPMLSYVFGPLVLAYSDEPTARLKGVFEILKAEPRIVPLGGAFDGQLFTHEGLEDVVRNVPSFDHLRRQLVSLLGSPSRSLLGTLSRPGHNVVCCAQLRGRQLESVPSST